jgi:ribosomal-protein-alanine N-acetyltransferase
MTGLAVALRPMRWWDIAAIMAIEDELFGDEAWTDTMYWSELAQRDTRHYRVIDGDSAFGTGHGAIAGYAGLCAYAHEAYVQTIAVTSAAQGHGLGTRLLLDLIDEAGRRGCDHVDLEVRADNDIARGLYERNGFTAIGLRRRYYQPSGVDAVVMRRVMADRVSA